MKKIGLFCGKETGKTAAVASQILESFGKEQVEIVYVEEAWIKDFEAYDNLIAGAATWFDGELPAYWDEIIPLLETIHLKNKKVAIFGLGDQKHYPDNFVDGIGILAKAFESIGAEVVGKTPIDGYEFNRSLASDGKQFAGLALDEDNEPEKTEQRIQNWISQLKTEFGLS
jgi:flavodoxin I